MTSNDFEVVFRTNYTRLYYFAYDFVGDMEVAKDIASDAFSKAWEMREEVDAHRLDGLLFVTVRNLCANYLRKQKTNQKYLRYIRASESEEDELYFQGMDERIAETLREVDKLPERTRHVIEECCLNSKSYKEVAEAMQISVSAVRKHVVKAYGQLRKHFNVKKQ